MTKFKTIREYMDLVPTCQFCGLPMETKLVGKKTPVHVPSYNMTFDNTVFYTETGRYIRQARKDKDKDDANSITYPSDQIDDNLNFYYAIGNAKGIILSVNVETGKVTGDIDRVQKVTWDHELTVARHCSSKTCVEGYVCESSPIYLERKSGTIFPFWLEIEGIVGNLEGKSYTLLSAHNKLKTTVLYTKDNDDIIKKLPLMHLYAIRGKENILNKIKTILVFS